jgi:fucose 4-O-acetylase-like acetyltransferase
MNKKTSEGAYFARGVVVSLMVYGHISFTGNSIEFQNHLYEILHSFRMPILIFLTGFFLNREKSAADILESAIRYILIPYLIFETLYLALHTTSNLLGIIKTNTPPIVSITEFLTTILLKPTGPFWFLYYLSIIQITVASIKALTQKVQGVSFDFAIISIGPLLAYSEIITPDFIIFYLLGMAYRLSSDDLLINPMASIFIILLTFTLGAASIDSSYLIRIPFVIAVMFLIVWIGQLQHLPNVLKVFTSAGRNSMSILCWHAFIIALMRPLANHFLLIDSSGIIYAVIITFLGVSGSLYLTRLSDKLGTSSIIFGMGIAFKNNKITK